MNNIKHAIRGSIVTYIDKEMAGLMFRNTDRHLWKVERYEPQVAMFLLFHNIPFTYNPDAGLTFVAPSIYVQNILTELADKNALFEPSIKKVNTIN